MWECICMLLYTMWKCTYILLHVMWECTNIFTCDVEVHVYIMTCGVRVLIYVMKCNTKVHKYIMISNSMHYELYSHGWVMFYLKSEFYLLVMHLLYYEASIIKSFMYLYIRCAVWECINISCYVILEFIFSCML